MNRLDRIAAEWDRIYALPAPLDPRRIGYGESFYTPTERFYGALLDSLGSFETALDVGCGNGQKLLRLATRYRIVRGTGIDISAGALAGAESLRRAYGVGPEVTFENVAFEDFVPKERFDLILAFQFVNYLPDPAVFFEKVKDWMTLGGTLVVADLERPAPIANRARRVVRQLLRRQAVDDGVTHHVADHVVEVAAASGFELVEKRSTCHVVSSVIVTPMHLMERHRFRSDCLRRLTKLAYIPLRWLWGAEDRLSPGGGASYVVVLTDSLSA